MKAYRFKDWNDLYENFSSRPIVFLSYYCQPNKIVGEGLGYMLMQKDGLELYGTLGFLKALASTAERVHRGWLVRNGTPMDALRMAMLTRLPVEKIQRALDFFSTAPMDWLTVEEWSPDGKPSSTHGPADGKPSSTHGPAMQKTVGLRTDKRSTEVPERERESSAPPSMAEVLTSRTRAGLLLRQIRELEADRANLSEADREGLRKKKRDLAALQAKQADGDFSHAPTKTKA